jgi:FkbM family methyltransferase
MINNLSDRVWIHPIALSNERGEVEFFEILNPSGTFAKYNLSGVGGLKKTHETQEHSVRKMVRAESLDDYSPGLALKSVDLIKIDTEGTEDLVLEGAAAIIKEYKPIIICETLFNKIESKLERIMKGNGYLFFNHVGGNLQRTETLERTTDNGVSDCFFVHPEKEHMIRRFVE